MPPASPVAMRSPFVCVPDACCSNSSNAKYASSRFSSATSPTSSVGTDDLRFRGLSDFEADDAAAADNEVLGSIARSAMFRVLAAASSSDFTSGEWTQRRRSAQEVVFEQRSARAFSIVARSMVPCSIDEISRVLSSEDSDQLNGSLIEILGDRFGYAVNVRSVPTPRSGAQSAHLSVKFVSFGRSRLLTRARRCQRVGGKRSATLLDFVETDRARRTACRVIQTIHRSQDLVTPAGERRSGIVGDALVGYVLREDPATKNTVVFFYGTHELGAESASENESENATLRESTVQTLRKMTCVTSKWVNIVRRRRLGAMHLLQSPRSLSLSSSTSLRALSSSCFTCDAPFQALLLRKKHFCCLCGYYTCGSCSSVEDAEERIGLVRRVRVCVDCLASVARTSFA